MRSVDDARRLVDEILERWQSEGRTACGSLEPVETDAGWVIGFQSREYLDGRLEAALAGNAPFYVARDGADAPHQLSATRSIDEQVRELES